MTMPAVGSLAPDFALPDQDGKEHHLSHHRGGYVLLYFYPADDSTGCTKEACVLRDAMPDFSKLNVKVFGVSPDSEESHKKFAEKYGLPFTLLSDENKEVINAYGVWGKKEYEGKEYETTLRTSFLIDLNGVIVKVYENVNPEVHAAEVLADMQKMHAAPGTTNS